MCIATYLPTLMLRNQSFRQDFLGKFDSLSQPTLKTVPLGLKLLMVFEKINKLKTKKK